MDYPIFYQVCEKISFGAEPYQNLFTSHTRPRTLIRYCLKKKLILELQKNKNDFYDVFAARFVKTSCRLEFYIHINNEIKVCHFFKYKF